MTLSPMNPTARSPRWILLLAGSILLAGCAFPLGEEVTPAQRALEIIVMGDGSGPDDCYVSYDELVAGTHLVSVGAEQPPAHARILSASGQAVFEADSEGHVGDGSEDEPEAVPADAQQRSVTLVPGEYQVECSKGSSVSTASLHVPGSTAEAAAPESRSPSPSDDASPGTKPHSGGGEDPYGIADTDWPVDLSGAKALYNRMPVEFNGQQADGGDWGDGTAGVFYGQAGAWSMEADGMPDARAALAMMFGMQMACDKTTYQGAAQPMQGGVLPGYGSGKTVDTWWFSCQAEGPDEGPENRSFLIGWASGEVGWLVNTPYETTSRELLHLIATQPR